MTYPHSVGRMNLSSLVHGARQQTTLQQSRPEHGLSLNRTRAHQPYTANASALAANPYSNKQPVHWTYTRSPQPPPSPPVEEMNRCTLPSISSLIGLTDGQPAHHDSRKQNLQPAQVPLLTAAQHPRCRQNKSRVECGLCILSSLPRWSTGRCLSVKLP